MSHEDRVREFDERLRQLCARIVMAEGAEFQTALLELANAISLWQGAGEDDSDNEKAASAG